ncbi:MAG: alkaline phosphatase family protein, partial [Ignavibacteriales bacterium]|nr:alkaline phosphatase family protein [Ignavibacteriales bacterium]
MKKLIFFLSLYLTISICVFAGSKPYVILVSFDGFRWDYLKREITPNLEKIKENGVSALSLRPAFPSKTFPNHLSIITGMYPAHHGIIANTFGDPFNKTVYRMGDTNA